MTTCPICAMKVDEEDAPATREYQGKKYFFCSTDDAEEFDSDPESYA